jgi:hypothetical protein
MVDDEPIIHDDGHTVMIEGLQDAALKPLYAGLPHLPYVFFGRQTQVITDVIYSWLCEVKPYEKNASKNTSRADFASICKKLSTEQRRYIMLISRMRTMD